jgi:hypothetical protein
MTTRTEGRGTKRWLSRAETDILRDTLVHLVIGPEGAAADGSIKSAVDLIDYALSTETGLQ